MDLFESLKRLEEDVDNYDDFEHLPVHSALEKRFRNTLYLGKAADGISLPVADIAVDLFQNAAEKNFGTFTRRHVAKFNRNGQVTPTSSMLGMMYARRLKQRKSDYLQKVTSTELFLVSMMLATKFLCDEGEDEEVLSDEWADSVNMDVKKVNELEREFLTAIDWDLCVEPDEFFQFLHQMETWIALNEGHRRGWFSYSDMNVLMGHANWHTTMSLLLEHVFKVLGICLAVYSFCSATLCWSLLVMQHHSTIPGISLDAGNHSHVFSGMRPLKTTQVASHQSEILLPRPDLGSEVDPRMNRDPTTMDAMTASVACKQCFCDDAQQRIASPGMWEYSSNCHWSSDVKAQNLALCQQCWNGHISGDFSLQNQITIVHQAMISFYHALLVAYYDNPVETLSQRNSTSGHPAQGRFHRFNRSASRGSHEAVPAHDLDVRCLHLVQSREERLDQVDSNDGDMDLEVSSKLQCPVCDGARMRGNLYGTVNLLLPISLKDRAVGSATSTLPIIVA